MKNLYFLTLILLLVSCNTESLLFKLNNSQNATAPAALACPTGFVAVTGSGTYSTSDFCVMQFEAKNDGAGNAVSTAASTPYLSIPASTAGADNDAFEKCANMSEVGFDGTFALISNDEWMTIARDIEATAANWSGGSVGSGHIPRGHSDESPFNDLAVTNPLDFYDGTGNNSGEVPGLGWEQRRVHILSNGSEIWDLAGNVWEWVDWDSSDSIYSPAPTGCVDGSSNTFNNEFNETIMGCSDGSAETQIYPLGGFTSAQSFGRWTGGSRGAALRGGNRLANTGAGPFSVSLFIAPMNSNSNIGFRCSYRP